MAQIFAYIVHKGGVADDSALELAAAAKKIDVDAELANHNATFPLMKLRSAILTGNTGMAHGDLRVAVVRG